MRTNVAIKMVAADTLPVTATLSVPASAPTGKSKLTFGKLTAPKKSGKTEYPAVPDELGELGKMGAAIRAVRAQLKAIQGQEQTLAFDIKGLVKNHAFKTWHGQLSIGSGFQFAVENEEPITVLLTAKYNIAKGENEKSPDLPRFESSMRAATGENYEKLFKDGFAVKVDGELIPVEKQQDFLNGLNDLVTKLQLDSGAIQAGPTIKHVKDFHTLRHSLLTPEQNAAVDEQYPMVIQVRT